MAGIVSKAYCAYSLTSSWSIEGKWLRLFIRDGPLENLLGGGVGEKYKKYIYIFAQGKIERKKIHARQLTLRNIHAMA